MKTTMILLLGAAFVAPAMAQTKSFRCQSDLAHLGDAKSSVQLKCGLPVLRDAFCKPGDSRPMPAAGGGAKVVINSVCETVDEWSAPGDRQGVKGASP